MMKDRKRERIARRRTVILAVAAVFCLAGCQGNISEVKQEKAVSAAGEADKGSKSALDKVESPGSQVRPDEKNDANDGLNPVGQEKQEEETNPGAESGPEGDAVQADSDDAESGQNSAEPAAGKREPPEGWELVLSSEDWGLSFGEPGTCPEGNATAEDLAWYDAYYVGDGSEKVIYLTFDCGYENGNTEPILDALKKHHVKATFFVVGHFLETAPDMVQRMAEEGHVVGNHTYHHLDMPSISDMETFKKEIDDVAALFRDITGKELARYYRPPQGKCNVQNLKMAKELGYRTVFWSLAYVDWNQEDQPSHEEAFDKLTTRVHPGAIVLLHNTSSTNGEILDELLTKWEEMGYTFRPLEELGSSFVRE